MEVAIRKMGNSQGILIPKPILAQIRLEGAADLQVRDGVIEIRPVRRNPREGWEEDARRIAETGEEALVWPEFGNEGDQIRTLDRARLVKRLGALRASTLATTLGTIQAMFAIGAS